jgi:hypothetical protein
MKTKGQGKFSHHSLQRAEEIGLTCAGLVSAWYRSTPWELSVRQKQYKFKVYGMQSLDDFYLYDTPTNTLFTCHDLGDITIIITVTHVPLDQINAQKIRDFLKRENE